MQLIDLSITIENNLPSDPQEMIPKITYIDHEKSVADMLRFFGKAKKEDLPNGLAWAIEKIQLTTHSGTHLDAPYHYHPTMDKGKPAWTIDQIPLDWCHGDGVVLDFSDKPDGHKLTIEDFEEALATINYQLKEKDIVLIRTGADQHWGTLNYLVSGCGVGREATLWLLNHGIRVLGTDAWSWDRPLPYIAKEFDETGDPSIIWEGHFAGIEKAYCHLEKLTNLDKLPPTGFKISCYPIKIKNASAGWVRAVALLEE
ncbi:cyclase [Enterococcus villorum]|uniref:Cyclase n=1 Tax=Enterococcus villorum TaxID=112904 RepID=A0A1V8YWI8_9ENTE|nr:cyclase family protein [Enterococcus villorum]OQO70284.1 cyclase [Enterococcus villorum]OQO77013.1 cyclase [Enterococcus villorum]